MPFGFLKRGQARRPPRPARRGAARPAAPAPGAGIASGGVTEDWRLAAG